MTGINGSVSALVIPAASSSAAQTPVSAAAPQTSGSGSAFGPASTLDLSPPAQAIVNGGATAATATPSSSSGSGSSHAAEPHTSGIPQATSTSSSSGSGASSASGASKGGAHKGAGGGGGASSANDTESLVEDAKRKVIPEVGVIGASEVVDNKGNIDETKLAELIAQQNSQP